MYRQIKKALLYAAGVLPALLSQAQSLPSDTLRLERRDSVHTVGNITVVRDSRVDALVERHILANTEKEGIPGYRVQVFSGSGKNAKTMADKRKSDVISAFPSVDVYVQWINPNYKVRAGNCRTRLEAEKLLREVTVVFPSSYIVQDLIRLPALD